MAGKEEKDEWYWFNQRITRERLEGEVRGWMEKEKKKRVE